MRVEDLTPNPSPEERGRVTLNNYVATKWGKRLATQQINDNRMIAFLVG
jgi:hypothetical protein